MIEIQVFRLVAGANEEAFIDCDRRLQTEVAYQQPGLLRRTIARGPAGAWIVVQLWSSEAAADDAGSHFAASPLTREWASFLQSGTASSSRWFELD